MQYFFRIPTIGGNNHTVALISLYTRPDPSLLKRSNQTLFPCRYTGNLSLHVISIFDIITSVAVAPLPLKPGEESLYGNYIYAAEKPFAEALVFITDDDDEDEDEEGEF